MTTFSEIEEHYEQIKDTPEIVDNLRTLANPVANTQSADNSDIRQEVLPDEKTHAKLQDKLSTMFDKSSRSGAQSKLHGLFLPNGRKMFAEFHDKYTGTGRFKPQKVPDKVDFSDKAPKIDPIPHRVILYERCPECWQPIDTNNFIPNSIFIPPDEYLTDIQRIKWRNVDVKPGTLVGYFFCMDCPKKVTEALAVIRHDPIKSAFVIGTDETGKQITMADKECQEYLKIRSAQIADNVFAEIKRYRDEPKEMKLWRQQNNRDIFFGNARIN